MFQELEDLSSDHIVPDFPLNFSFQGQEEEDEEEDESSQYDDLNEE